MPKKMKMTLQRAENLVHVKQHYGDSICKKIFFLFRFIQLIWPSKCLILTILTLAKCLQNLLRDSTWSVISIAKKFLFKVVSMMLKMPIVTFFFLTTLYILIVHRMVSKCLFSTISGPVNHGTCQQSYASNHVREIRKWDLQKAFERYPIFESCPPLLFHALPLLHFYHAG